jgi:bifunctional non-homologous end joining protein LigD
MLATSGRPVGGVDGWMVEPKLDGWRSIVTVHAGCLDVRTRNGRDITDCVPELEPLTAGSDLVLDGELIVGAGRLSDFYRLAGRLAGKPTAGSEAVVLVAFDLLWLGGEQLTARPYWDRRARLESLELAPVQVVPSYDAATADDLLAACGEQGMEGVVLKRAGSVYRPGKRSGDWRKVKCEGWREHLERRVTIP